MVAEYAAPVGVTCAIPRGAVAVTMFAAGVRLALGAKFTTPAWSATEADENSVILSFLAPFYGVLRLSYIDNQTILLDFSGSIVTAGCSDKIINRSC